MRIVAAVSFGLSMLISVSLGSSPAAGKAFSDPAPPAVRALATQPSAAAHENPDATFHAPPKPLPQGAVTEDWPCFLGPNHNLVSNETRLLKQFPKGGPTVVWEMSKGTGYCAPAILGERLVLFHRVGDRETVDCVQTETGKRFWRFDYPTDYIDRYGYCDGPRASPVIGGDAVFTIGAEGKLHCIELATGRVRWSRDLLKEFKLKQNFFGVGSTPLIEGDKLIVNIGAPDGPCVAAFNVKNGRMLWGAGEEWGPSYASPIPADIYGKRRVFVFAGGETGPRQPVSGGLLCLDPANGKIDFAFPWRGTRRESVNASSPLVLSGAPPQVLVSECYGSGGALLDILPDFTCKTAWTDDAFGTHFMTAVEKNGYLYGVDGHGPNDAFLVCVDRKTGKEVWRTQPEWKEPAPGGREMTMGTYRAQLMPVDGRCLCLGEFGHLLWIDLNPKGYKELDRAALFAAGETWSPPVLSRGLLYINQNTPERRGGKGPRIICYDLRGTE